MPGHLFRLTIEKTACWNAAEHNNFWEHIAFSLWHELRILGLGYAILRFLPYAISDRLLTTEASMEMFGRVGLVEIPILIAPDQKVWMDKMIKEGRIAVPPGGTLEKGSLYSMFIRMLLHNAMEEQKRQEALEADDDDEE